MAMHVSEEAGIATIVLDRPPVNAIDLDIVTEVERAFEVFSGSPPELGVIITGAGDTFSAGVDTKAFVAYEPERKREMVRAITRMTAAIWGLPGPVVSAVNGHALGGGFVLMLCGDYRLCTDDDSVKLGITEARAGIPFPAGPLEIIRHELPAPLLRQLALSSRVLSPRTLESAGVIDQLSAPESLIDDARAALTQLAGQPAFASVKQQVRGPLAARLRALAASGEDPLLEYF